MTLIIEILSIYVPLIIFLGILGFLWDRFDHWIYDNRFDVKLENWIYGGEKDKYKVERVDYTERY